MSPVMLRALIGIQAQIEPAAGISLWNRTSGLTASHFDELIYKDRTLVKLWGQRGTLHLNDLNCKGSKLYAINTQRRRGDPFAQA